MGFYRADLAGRGFLPKANRVCFSRPFSCTTWTDMWEVHRYQIGDLCFPLTHVTVDLIYRIA